VGGFLGALGLTAMVLIIQSPSAFQKPVWVLTGDEYFSLLVVLLALMVVCSVFSTVVHIDVAGGVYSWESRYATVGYKMLGAAWFLLMIVLPLLLYPITPLGALIVGAAEVFLFAVIRIADEASS